MVTQLPRKALALAAYLAQQKGPAERSVLADLLWEGDEETVRRNLRQELFRLKNTPWEEVIVQVGQNLTLGNIQTDLEQFLGHLAKGEWGEALGLWRGGLLLGFDLKASEAFWDWLIPERERWDRLFREAALGLARSLEAQGQLAEALRLYQDLLDQDPLQEAEQMAFMRLQVLRGDRTAALRQYETYRSLLQQQLSLEPSPEMQALFNRLRQGGTLELDLEASLRRILVEPPLVGRSTDWAWLESHWGKAVLLLAAEAGVGKSRLLLDFAKRKGETLRIIQRESSQGVGFGGLLEALGTGLDGATLQSLEPVWRDELARIWPQAGAVPSKSDPNPPNKVRLFEALARALQAMVRPGGVVLWEDLHWMDWASLEFLPYLARRAASLGIYVLASVRSESLNSSEGVARTLGELRREERLMIHHLSLLSKADLVELIRGMSGQKSGSELFSERLYQATAGNVFFVLETLRYLFEQGLLRAEDGVWRTPFDDFTTDYHELPIPPSVRETLLGRLQRLGEGAMGLVQAFALADLPLLPEAAASLSNRLEAPIGDLETLLVSGFIRQDSSGYSLRHELTRQAVLAEMSESRKRWMHSQIAETLREVGGPLAQLAGHLEAAGQRTKAYEAHAQAGRSLRYGPLARQALEHFTKAQALFPPLESDHERFKLLMEAAETRVVLGQTRFSERHQLGRLAQDLGASERYRLRLLDADSALSSGLVTEGIAAAQEALSLARTSGQRGHALFKLAWLEYRGGDPDAQLTPLTQAIQAFHQTADYSMEALALRNLSGYGFRLGDIEQFNHNYQRSWKLATELEDTFLLRRLRADKALVDWVRGDYQSSVGLAQGLYAEARERGDWWALWDALQALLHNAAVLGLDAELESTVRGAMSEAAEVGAWRDLALLRADFGAALLTENRLSEAQTELAAALRDLREMGERAHLGHTLFFLGYTLLELRDSERSQALLQEAAELWQARKEYRHQARALSGLSLAQLRLGDREGARTTTAQAISLRSDWAKGIFDLPLVLYARSRALGGEEGKPLLRQAQQSLTDIAQQLSPLQSERFRRNRFVVWAMSKKA